MGRFSLDLTLPDGVPDHLHRVFILRTLRAIHAHIEGDLMDREPPPLPSTKHDILDAGVAIGSWSVSLPTT